MLNSFGKLAVVEVVVYIPVALVAFYVTLRYASTNRRKAWAFLLTFAMIRSTGAVLTIVSQHETNPSKGLLTAVGILPVIGLGTLLLVTHSLVSAISKKALPNFPRFLQLVRVVIAVGIILSIISKIGQALGPAGLSITTAHNLFKVSIALFVAGYLAILGVLMRLWAGRGDFSIVYYKFLRNISIAMPFLAVRVLYSAAGAFSLANSEVSTIFTKWKLFLFLALIMELVIVCIYLASGIIIPVNDEETGSSEKPPPPRENRLKKWPQTRNRAMPRDKEMVSSF